jgi:hypothetical protein
MAERAWHANAKNIARPAVKHRAEVILEGFDWLANDSERGDVLVFHFCGKGSPEGILPYDHDLKGKISNDLIHAHLMDNLREGVTLFSMMDHVHSSPIGFRYSFLDKSVGPKHIQKSILNEFQLKESAEWVQKCEEKENYSVPETSASVIFLRALGVKDSCSLSKCFLYILENNYSHTLTLFDLMCKLSALLVINNLGNSTALESGKLIDLNAPFGRFICAPL